MSATLPPMLRDKLVKICARLGSDHDGERAAAALLASRMVDGAGLSWEDVIPSSGQNDVARMVADAVRTAQANAAQYGQRPVKPRRPRRTHQEQLRSERFGLLLAIIGGSLHLLKPHELEQYRTGTVGPYAWNRWAPSDHAMQAVEYLAGVIRRRMEDAA